MEFDFSQILVVLSEFISQSTGAILFQLFIIGGWLFIIWMLIFLGIFFYQEYRQGIYTSKWRFVLLAIDIPPNNFQTPKAVEQLFAHLAGAHSAPDIAGAYRGGYVPPWFSFEIISIDGYIQFLVWTEQSHRDLVEAAIYAQYPEAEITEVQDYVDEMPKTFPNDTHDMWAADFGLSEHEAFPIRTYQYFEHKESPDKEKVLKDPMSALLESFSRISHGEQMWLQILVTPAGSSWKEKSIKKVKEMIGDSSAKAGPSAFDKVADFPLKVLEGVGDQIFAREASASSGGDDSGPPNKLQYLTPGQSRLVEAMEDKMSKSGFKTKIRGVYIARKEVFNPQRGVSALIGALNQFNVPSSNSIVPTSGVGASYFFTNSRKASKKNLMMLAYKKRKIKMGASPFVLNLEELATLWHFPLADVRTPLLQKTQIKQTEPPAGLPVEFIGAGAQLPGFDDMLVLENTEPREPEKNSMQQGYQTDAGDMREHDNLPFG